MEEVWFAGCHSDVGGGAVEDAVRYLLADALGIPAQLVVSLQSVPW